jgi:hypothetical protein
MEWLRDAGYFLGGVFLANAIPHFVSGMIGRLFQSPFARPPGQELSSSTVNVLYRRRTPTEQDTYATQCGLCSITPNQPMPW